MKRLQAKFIHLTDLLSNIEVLNTIKIQGLSLTNFGFSKFIDVLLQTMEKCNGQENRGRVII